MSEKPHIIPTHPVESSQIAELGYDPATSTMAIRFPARSGPGSLYHYSNVSQDDFDAFKSAESIGRHFGQHIKPNVEKYPFQKITDETIFTAHCECCDQPATITYRGEVLQSIKCGCPIRIALRAEEHQHFVGKIREAKAGAGGDTEPAI